MKNVLRANVLFELHQKAAFAYQRMQWVVRLHPSSWSRATKLSHSGDMPRSTNVLSTPEPQSRQRCLSRRWLSVLVAI